MRGRSVWWLGLTTLATLVVRGIWTRRRAVAIVPPDTRIPMLYVPVEVRSPLSLRLRRSLATPPPAAATRRPAPPR